MPLRLFRSRNISGANLVQALLVAGMFSMFFLGALYLQEILGYDALKVGLAFLPCTLVMGAMSLRLSGPLAMRFGPVPVLAVGLALGGAGLLLFARTPVHGSYWADIMPAMLVTGLGVGVAFPALTTVAMSGVTSTESGLASGLINTTAQVGGAVGLAVLNAVATAHTNGLSGLTRAAALNSGYHLAYLVAAALILVAIGTTIGLLRVKSPRITVERRHDEAMTPAYSD